MGWTDYHVDGKVNRIDEVRKYFEKSSDPRRYKMLKAVAKGDVVYAAVEYFPQENQREVFAAIFLTHVDNTDYNNFMYKDLDESCGPFETECPASILNLLTPTKSRHAAEWRKACWKNIEKAKAKRKDPNSLSNLPVGSKIEMNYWKDVQPTIILTKRQLPGLKRPIWVDEDVKFKYSAKTIESQGYAVLVRGCSD